MDLLCFFQNYMINFNWSTNFINVIPGIALLYFSMYRYIEPIPQGSMTKFEFDNMIVGQVIPSNFIPAIEKGFKEAANSWVAFGKNNDHSFVLYEKVPVLSWKYFRSSLFLVSPSGHNKNSWWKFKWELYN